MPSAQDAEDAVSAAVVKAYQKADTLRKEERLKPWMMKITVRCCYDQLRKSKREQLSDNLELFDQPVFTTQDELYGLLGELPADLRQPLILRYYENMPVGEIAHVLGLARPAVSMRLKRGRQRLYELLTAEGSAEQ